jgi:8-oxo-dGTP diphosphatase
MAEASKDGIEALPRNPAGGDSQSGSASDLVPRIRVAAAVIERQGRYLITQRSSTAVLAGLWEFPNCKVGGGETDQTALRRELRERVGINAEVGISAASRTQRYDGYFLDLVLYRASIPPDQEPYPVRVADLRWVKPDELENYAFPPADQVTTDLLLGIGHDSCLEPPRTQPSFVRS